MPHEPEDRVSALEAELRDLAAADADLERDAEIAERTRIERSKLSLADRMRGARDPVELATVGGGQFGGRVVEVGADWVLVRRPPDQHAPDQHAPDLRAPATEHLVMLASVLAVRRLSRSAVPTLSRLPERSSASVLRSWCRDRAEITVLLVDGSPLVGRASAAFADHVELVSAQGEPVAVPLTAIAAATRG